MDWVSSGSDVFVISELSSAGARVVQENLS